MPRWSQVVSLLLVPCFFVDPTLAVASASDAARTSPYASGHLNEDAMMARMLGMHRLIMGRRPLDYARFWKALVLAPWGTKRILRAVALRANYIPLTTPLTDTGDHVDVDALRDHLAVLKAKGAQGVMVVGTTGESNKMTPALRLEALVTLTREAKAFGLRVITNATGDDLQETKRNAKAAEDAGADAVVVAPLRIVKEAAKIKETLIAIKSDLKPQTLLALYNLPMIHQDTSLQVPPEIVRGLYQDGVIAMVKDSSGNKELFLQYVADGLPVYQGNEGLMAWAMLNGARGTVSALGNVNAEANHIPFAASELQAWQSRLLEWRRVLTADMLNFYTRTKYFLHLGDIGNAVHARPEDQTADLTEAQRLEIEALHAAHPDLAVALEKAAIHPAFRTLQLDAEEFATVISKTHGLLERLVVQDVFADELPLFIDAYIFDAQWRIANAERHEGHNRQLQRDRNLSDTQLNELLDMIRDEAIPRLRRASPVAAARLNRFLRNPQTAPVAIEVRTRHYRLTLEWLIAVYSGDRERMPELQVQALNLSRFLAMDTAAVMQAVREIVEMLYSAEGFNRFFDKYFAYERRWIHSLIRQLPKIQKQVQNNLIAIVDEATSPGHPLRDLARNSA